MYIPTVYIKSLKSTDIIVFEISKNLLCKLGISFFILILKTKCAFHKTYLEFPNLFFYNYHFVLTNRMVNKSYWLDFSFLLLLKSCEY